MMRGSLVISCLLFSFAVVLMAAEGTEKVGPRPDLRLTAYAGLSTKVSGALVREDMAKVVAFLTEKSGVKLSLTDAVKAERLRLTMSIRDMPLGEAMTAIALLYGLQWSKAGEGFVLEHYHPSLTSPMRRLMRSGPPGELSNLLRDRSREDMTALARSLDEHLTNPRLNVGIALNSLPPPVQQKVTAFVKQRATNEVTVNARRMCPDSLVSAVVRKSVGRDQFGREVYGMTIDISGYSLRLPWLPPHPSK